MFFTDVTRLLRGTPGMFSAIARWPRTFHGIFKLRQNAHHAQSSRGAGHIILHRFHRGGQLRDKPPESDVIPFTDKRHDFLGFADGS